jgi:hypothetical protein
MADAFKLLGGYTVTPLGSALSFAPSLEAVIDEPKSIKAKELSELLIIADPAVSVPFGGVLNAHIVLLKATGKCEARITSAAGAAQVVAFDTYLILMSDSVPVTAITLTRVAGVDTTVRVFLAEKA